MIEMASLIDLGLVFGHSTDMSTQFESSQLKTQTEHTGTLKIQNTFPPLLFDTNRKGLVYKID